jgi:hypothetical protein
MPVWVCSLIRKEPQVIPPGDAYHVVRFRFGMAESSDPHGMHQVEQPDGVTTSFENDRAGLIWPAVDGWGELKALMYWAPGQYSEIRSRFVRDPLNIAGGADSTCTEDRRATPGAQFVAKAWGIFVQPRTPIALMVRHNGASRAVLTHAQFKLAIQDVATSPV